MPRLAAKRLPAPDQGALSRLFMDSGVLGGFRA